ncbi:MAG: DUF4423 domain-containing protein [Bdellovibrionaceae bacterium]|nr:DUF4423 domain-containing protein [Pseudobdellovibrionaceae bacterium]
MGSLDYRLILKQAFEQRTRSNPQYSLRAFSRDLKVAPSQMSGIMKGTLGLSRASALVVGKSLGMTKREVEAFVDLVDARHARSRTSKKLAKIRVRQRFKGLKEKGPSLISLDQFKFVSDWYHLALLELSYLKSFTPDILWISRKLGISTATAGAALERLSRLGLIVNKGNVWKTTEDWSVIGEDCPSAAIRAFHSQLLKKAELSLALQNLEDREVNSTIMAIRKNKIEEAKGLLKKFHEDFCMTVGEMESMKYEKDEVYCLTTAFFSLSHPVLK